MVLKLPLAQKRMFWAFQKIIFHYFINFSMDEVETIFGESYTKHSKLFKSTFGHKEHLRKGFWNYLEIKNECCERLKRAFFSYLQTFEWRSGNQCLGKWGKALKAIKIKIWFIGSFLENGFESTLSSKMSVVSAWKEYFSVFCKFFIEEVETIFWESEGKHSKPFKSKFGHRKVFTKWFWSYLELKNECCDCLKRAFSSFLEIFKWLSWDHFLGN